MKTISVGSIVKFENSFYRVSAVIGKKNITFNLASIFGSKIYFKRIASEKIIEASDEWYNKWSKSEAYQCM